MSERGCAFLVVEDHEGLRRQLERVLAHFGTVVAIATVGDAFKALASREFDGLWIDIRLPDGSGVEILSHARQNRQQKGYATLVSADLEPHLVNEAYRFEAQYLVKPFSLTDVHAFVARSAASTRSSGSLDERLHEWVSRYGLTATEKQILRAAALGERRNQLIDDRHISAATLKQHIRNLLAKTGDRSLSAATIRLLGSLRL